MTELKCPKCGQVFTVDESDYAALLQQVRTHEFNDELEKRLNDKLKDERTIAQQKFDSEMERLKAEQEKALLDKDSVIAELKRDAELAQERQEHALSEQSAELARKQNAELEKIGKSVADRDSQIADLKHKLEMADSDAKLRLAEANAEKDKKINELENTISSMNKDKSVMEEKFELEKKNVRIELESELDSQKTRYETLLKHKEEELEQEKNYKKMLTTKMVGESLERHCEDEFNKLRMTAFPNAYFAKDNAISESGSKGDYIYREEIDGVELISIMFEMKNENDTTKTKHHNKDFFKELDKDRREKNCEYAVLVSMLEQDSEFYNAGIVDVSYEYGKMYVIRPQFFIPMITLLRNAAMKSLETKKQLEEARRQNIDLTNFENNMESFKTGFARNYNLASTQFEKAIKEIDDSIKKLEDVKRDLKKSADNLRLANDKAQKQLTIKKLTKNAPSVKDMLEAQKQAALTVSEDDDDEEDITD
ncbi:hypothetical protein SAMN02910447_00567 [Ruminococcus sp. YE71]|uniref:DUF2130 domain-containing protein n=1 Tax=unclassified Ruminococcus TaxID=2608920 RepID=UPI00088A0137|nr:MULTISPECIES: DUF2130 domain-containing protein [unclassified Ruminococcus]SDA12271.1 hypothetical protein SAMN02910446_00566 [Ruminococcus sp. YE78]SFW16661.1 hypothetical protein SAMN02910447_00567 [Ruminococcus sp. YE71]